MALQFLQILYWLALSTWFGGALFIAVAVRVIFTTVQENNPILPHVLSVNLDGQHGTVLAGTIVGNLLTTFVKIELICGGVLAMTLIGQFILLDLHDSSVLLSAILRSALLVSAMVMLVYDWRSLWPRIWKSRQEFLDHADDPDKANPAKDEFDRYQRESVVILQIVIFLLLGIVLFSSAIGPATVRQIVPATPPANTVRS